MPVAAPSPATPASADRPRPQAGGKGGPSFAHCLQRSAQATLATDKAEVAAPEPAATGQDATRIAQLRQEGGAPEAEREAPPREELQQEGGGQAVLPGGFAWPDAAALAPPAPADAAAGEAAAPGLRALSARRDPAMAARRQAGQPEGVGPQRPGLRDGDALFETMLEAKGAGPGGMAPRQEAGGPPSVAAAVPAPMPGPSPAGPAGEAAWLPPGWPALSAPAPATEPARHGSVQVYNIATAADSPEFAGALTHQVSYLLREGVQEARLNLNPAELGPVHVHIALVGQQAQVEFSAAVASTRAALESSLPLLATVLQAAGLALGGAGVSQQQDPGGGQQRPPRAGRVSAGAGGPAERIAGAQPPAQRAGRLDLYA